MRNLQKKNIIYCAGIIIIFYCFFGCTSLQTQIKEGTFIPHHKKYTVSIPGKGWEVLKAGGEDIALWNRQHHATIAFISSRKGKKELTQDMLGRLLFIGLKRKKVVLKESVLVDNYRAMHTVLGCEMDEQKMKIDSYVIETGGMIYDLLYWSPLDTFDCMHDDFEKIIQSFSLHTG